MIILLPVCIVNIFQAFNLVVFVALERIKQTAAREFGERVLPVSGTAISASSEISIEHARAINYACSPGVVL
jgi:hypothetical protein